MAEPNILVEMMERTEEKFIKQHEPLIEEYRPWLEMKGAGTLTPYRQAVTAILLDNARKSCLPNSRNLGEAQKMALNALEMMGYDPSLKEATTPTTTTAWSGATNLPFVLGYIRKVMPKIVGLELVNVIPISSPTARIFYLNRIRHDNATDAGIVEARAGWSFRSWVNDPGEATAITKSVKFTLTSADVSVASRKLKAETSIEVEQDIRAYYGMDANALLSDAASDELAMEINEWIVHWLWSNASGGTVYVGAKPSTYTFAEWERKHLEALNRATSLVANRYLIQPNWMLLGAEQGVRIGNWSVFEPSTDKTPGSFGLRRVGTLRNQWDTYEMASPFPTDTALIGYKGESIIDAGAVWAPYVPLMVAGTNFDPATQMRTISWIRRDAYKMVNAGYYSLCVIDEATYTGLSYPAWVEYSG